MAYEDAPVKVDLDTAVDAPFSLDNWLAENEEKINVEGSVDLFKTSSQAHVCL